MLSRAAAQTLSIIDGDPKHLGVQIGSTMDLSLFFRRVFVTGLHQLFADGRLQFFGDISDNTARIFTQSTAGHESNSYPIRYWMKASHFVKHCLLER